MKPTTFLLTIKYDGSVWPVSWPLPVIARMFDAQAFEMPDGSYELRRPIWTEETSTTRRMTVVVASPIRAQPAVAAADT
jgi:hypothetical protein